MKNHLRFPSPGFHARRRGSFLNRATFCLSFEFDERGNDYEGRNCLSFEDEKERTCFFCKSNRLGLNFTTILFSFQQLDSAITIPSIFHSCLNGALGFFFQILQHFEHSYSATNYTHFINNFQIQNKKEYLTKRNFDISLI